MRQILKNNKLIALHFEGNFEEGTKPQTAENLALQVIALKHSKGKILTAHAHAPKMRTTEQLMECLLILSGKVRATVYADKEIIEQVELQAGSGLMIVSGGVGYEILENATMLEFKNGPFLEDKIVI